MKDFSIVLLCFNLLSCFMKSLASDNITSNQEIIYQQSLVSAGGVYELGFFRPDKNSKHMYLGIWYKISPTIIVWVANKNVPLKDTSGVLTFDEEGNLVLVDSTDTKLWSTNSSRRVNNPIAQLLDSGNLVVMEENNDVVWQSFDYMYDTFLPGVKYGIDLSTGIDRHLKSWKSTNDPSPGVYTNKLDPSGYPQMLLRKGSDVIFRSGPWNGLHFSGMPNLKPNMIYTYEFVITEQEVYYKYELINSSVYSRMILNEDGLLQRYTWSDLSKGWNLYLTAQMDNCDKFALCGAFGSCNINNSPPCECLRGFKPRFPVDWEAGGWSTGCVRKSGLECGRRDGFQLVKGVKLPDTRTSWYNTTMGLRDCARVCRRNCSCTAFAKLDISWDGTGCLLWFGDLIDIRQYAESGQDMYVRLADSDIDYSTSERYKHVLSIVLPITFAILLLGIAMVLYFQKKKQKKQMDQQLSRKSLISQNQETDGSFRFNNETREKDFELPLFDFATIRLATSNFAAYNKIGEGGYGPVYKGTLIDGKDIAVKRLSKNSRQGTSEFQNEVMCIARLQHRNLVKLLGCCIEVEEQMLVYEFMPNGSLNAFIFDKRQRVVLDWPKRFNIIKGIARGLLYLHQDSRLRIIHRDLKASNILLDHEMNPKISDFGLARSFGGNETEANTNRVVGTYGYMSPEYAIDGVFSIKSDVFSFGVLVLEIISGKRNRGFFHTDHKLNLLGHAWRLYKEGKSLELIDDILASSCIMPEVSRSVQAGLLCVQENPEDRPNMATVVLMLTSDLALPDPKEPGFFTERRFFDTDSSSSKRDQSHSVNNMSMTLLSAR